MFTEPTHIDRGVLDLLLTDAHNLVGVRGGSPIGTSDHSVLFIDVILGQSIPHLVCRQELYLKTRNMER